jgi:hypothetical protein
MIDKMNMDVIINDLSDNIVPNYVAVTLNARFEVNTTVHDYSKEAHINAYVQKRINEFDVELEKYIKSLGE